jgi:hypothetical protein
LQVSKNDKCRGEHLQNLQKNVACLISTFESAASEAGHLAYKDALERKMKKAEVTPDKETIQAVLRSEWMVENKRNLLDLNG